MKYDEKEYCCKCGRVGHELKYIKIENDEYIFVKCIFCGYAWIRDVIVAEKR